MPTTRPLPRRTAPEKVRPARAHRPLVAMLVLTQAGVGLLAADLALRVLTPRFDTVHAPIVLLGSALGLLGTAASVFHLGRPLGAWRAVLGLRTSWLGREIAAFGLFAALVAARLVLSFLERLVEGRLPSGAMDPLFHGAESLWGTEAVIGGMKHLSDLVFLLDDFSDPLRPAVVLAGLAAVWISATIYAGTGRASWGRGRTAFRFYGTAALAGVSGAAAVLSAIGCSDRLEHAVLAAVMALAAAKVAGETVLFVRPAAAIGGPASARAQARTQVLTPLRRTALLHLGPLFPLLRLRVAAALAGGIVVPFLLVIAPAAAAQGTAPAGGAALLGFLLVLGGEALERHLFFVSSSPPRTPGYPGE